jgi:hypothetical protein
MRWQTNMVNLFEQLLRIEEALRDGGWVVMADLRFFTKLNSL